MRASSYTCYLREFGEEELFRALEGLRDVGIVEADIIDDELRALPLREYKAMLSKRGILATTVVSVEDILARGDVRRGAAILGVRTLIDEMASLGIKNLMLAPPVGREGYGDCDEIRERMLESYGKIIEHAGSRGVCVSIENQSSTHRPDSKICDIEYLLGALPSLGFTLDSGNFLCVGEDVLSAYEKFKSRTVRAHIKDFTCPAERLRSGVENIRRQDLSGCAIGDGVLPLEELTKRMKQDGLRIALTLEINAAPITPDMIMRSAKRLVSFINS